MIPKDVISKTLYFVAQNGWENRGTSFFESLVKYLGEEFGFEYVLVDKLVGDDEAETVALYSKGKIVPNLKYSLDGTPCENVAGKGLCHCCLIVSNKLQLTVL